VHLCRARPTKEDYLKQWLIRIELPLLFDRKQIMTSDDVTL